MNDAPTTGDTPMPEADLSPREGLKAAIAGVLMGLANLVPGLSGGTMLLACGVYPRFVDTVANLTLFRFRMRSLLWLATLVAGAVLAVVLLAGTVKHLVETYPTPMHALFIGLTLGGVPALLAVARPLGRTSWIACALAFGAMFVMAFARPAEVVVGAASPPALPLFVAGLAGASAMVLPGISGSYLLLLLGQYVTILSAIDRARAGEMEAVWVLLPFAAGVAVGIATVPHMIRAALRHAPATSYGLLLGLLLGAVPGLWPFRSAPTAAEGTLALATGAVGFALTRLASRLASPPDVSLAGEAAK